MHVSCQFLNCLIIWGMPVCLQGSIEYVINKTIETCLVLFLLNIFSVGESSDDAFPYEQVVGNLS